MSIRGLTRLAPESIQDPSQLRGRSVEELQELSGEVRRFLIESISKTGGHIGANLGTVELSIALHASFESPREAIVWDTGHQGYTHKILIGRASMFPSLNSYGGMNRFVSRSESEHDVVEASHAGTSVSIALGIALARRLEGDDAATVAVIGDGALAEGMALEALNHAAVEDTNLVCVLNDNGFAISPGFGGLHEVLQDGGEGPRVFFETLGFAYVGPVDGHDVGALLEAFRAARDTPRPALVHVKTTKEAAGRRPPGIPSGSTSPSPSTLVPEGRGRPARAPATRTSPRPRSGPRWSATRASSASHPRPCTPPASPRSSSASPNEPSTREWKSSTP